MNMHEYLNELESQIRNKKAREYVTEEIKTHIEDQANAFSAEGMPPADAMAEAVRQMGDPIETGVSLDRIHRPKMEWQFLLFIIGLSVLSIGIQWLIGDNLQHAVFSIIGIGCMLVVCYLDYSLLGKNSFLFAAVFLFVMFISIYVLGISLNGSRSFVAFGSFTISLQAMMYLYPPIYGALLYSCRGGGYRALLKCLLFLIFPVYLAMVMPLISLSVTLSTILLIMLSTAIIKGWFQVSKALCLSILWGGITVLPFALFMLAYKMNILADYQTARLLAYFRTGTLPKWLVNVPRQSFQENRELYTDYLIAYLTQYYGALAGILLIGLLTLLVYKTFRIAVRQKNQLGMIVGIGCSLVFATQTLMYLLINLGALPGTIAYLPLFSFGGTATLVTYCLLGLILSIYRYQNVVPNVLTKKKKKPISI